MESLGAPKIILGGLSLYKLNAPSFVVGCPNPLEELYLCELKKRSKDWMFIANSSSKAHQVTWIHPFDHPGSRQQEW